MVADTGNQAVPPEGYELTILCGLHNRRIGIRPDKSVIHVSGSGPRYCGAQRFRVRLERAAARDEVAVLLPAWGDENRRP
jgi:hypothetical protein